MQQMMTLIPFFDDTRSLQNDTDEQIVEMFLSICCKSPYTRRNYKKAIERFRQFISLKPLREVSWREIEAYKIGLLHGYCSIAGEPLSVATVAGLIAPIRSLYKWGSDPNIAIFPHNPTTCVRMPKVPINSQNHYLTKQEVSKLLAKLKEQGPRDYLIGLTLVLLGLRVSELVSIRRNHFHADPSGSFIWLTVVNGKGGKQREVKVPILLWELLMQHDRGIRPTAISSTEFMQSNELLFPLSIRQVERIIQRARQRSQIEKNVTPHWLRHTNATLALLNGASLQQVQETLGHSHLNTTQRYLHTVDQIKKAAPDFVEDSIRDLLETKH